jgi:hypothetical protein
MAVYHLRIYNEFATHINQLQRSVTVRFSLPEYGAL